MKFKGLYTAMTALSLIAAPTLAAAAPIATPLTQPATEMVQGDSELNGGSSIFVLLLALAAIGAGIWAATSSDSDPVTAPTSP